MKIRAVNFLLFVVSSALMFAAGEFYLRAFPTESIYMQTRNIVQQTHSDLSEDYKLQYIPKAGLDRPFSNIEFRTEVRINSKNMRDREYSSEKPAGVRRIAAMGDSFVFGWGVEVEQTFSKLLERKLERTEVLNFGISGYSAESTLQWLRTRALDFDPDVVLFCVYGFPDPPELQPVEMLDGKLYRAPYAKLSLKDRTILFLIRHSRLFDLFLEAKYRFDSPEETEELAKAPAENEPQVQASLGLIDDLRGLAQAKGLQAVVVYIPAKYEVEDRGTDRDRALKEILEKKCRTGSLRFLDMTGPLKKYWKETGHYPYFRLDDHWNRWGHEAVAAELASFLKKEGLAG